MTGVGYDSANRGRFPVGVRTVQTRDAARDNRLVTIEVWYPAAEQHRGQDLASESQDVFTVPPGGATRRQKAARDASAEPGFYPLIVFSHSSGADRRQSTFLSTHLASHGYVVAAMDHTTVAPPGPARSDEETAEQKAVRIEALIASRVPDVRFLLDQLLAGAVWDSEACIDPDRVGIVGHSFGGWTALAAPDVEPRIRAIVALAPGGASQRKPGILPLTLAFNWGRDVPTLYIVAENDISLPLSGMYELFERTPSTKQIVALHGADHLHFMDNTEELHEMFRNMAWSGELSWIAKEMRPIAELASGDMAHGLISSLAVCHMDAILKSDERARRLLWPEKNRMIDVPLTPR